MPLSVHARHKGKLLGPKDMTIQYDTSLSKSPNKIRAQAIRI